MGNRDVTFYPNKNIVVGDYGYVELAKLETQFMLMLGERFGQHCSNNEILTEIYGYEDPSGIKTKAPQMLVSRLRKKLDSIGESELIKTVRSYGYVILDDRFVIDYKE